MWNSCYPRWSRTLKVMLTVAIATLLFVYFFSDSKHKYRDNARKMGVSDIQKTVSKSVLNDISTAAVSPTADLEEASHDVPVSNQTTFHKPITNQPKNNFKPLQTSLRNHSPHKVVSSSNSYVLAESYWEQQTSGCRNLHSLQCWAGRYGFSVVEPFFGRSYLRIPFVTMKSSTLKFSDAFDLDDWNRRNAEIGSSKLVPWEVFLRKAPRKVVTVFFKYSTADSSLKGKTYAKPNLSRPRYLQGCPDMQAWPNKHQMHAFKKFKFIVVRKVCVNFEFGDQLSLDDFHEAIFGRYRQKDVTVFFQHWRNFGTNRILVQATPCCNCSDIQEHMRASKHVNKEAEMYARKYLSNSKTINSTQSDGSYPSYVAIIARLERVQLSFKNREDIIPFCFEKILSYHNQVVANNSLHKTFLAIDVGKFGSDGLLRKKGSNLYMEFYNFFQKLYGSEQSIQTWERTLEDVSRSSDAGYVALLQKVIVSKAECVIFIGGGSFQRHTLKLYQLNHQGGNQCVHVVKECTLEKQLSQYYS